MKKVISILIFLVLFYVLPLSVKPELLMYPKVIFLAAICTVLFATQPRFSITESKQKFSSDKNTVWLILIVSGFGQITSLMEWAYFRQSLPDFSTWTIIGAIMLIAGTVFRLHAIKVLGKYFSATVQIKDEHRIISQGPYSVLRHPSYTGAYIAMLGCAVFLHSFIGILIFGVGMLYVYHKRIRAEENTLTEQFKQEYVLYSKRTFKMFPYIW
ncbi:MAG: isoprenylcysteine carboxylmethyltransferase family protein [Bacteroidia bacterium]